MGDGAQPQQGQGGEVGSPGESGPQGRGVGRGEVGHEGQHDEARGRPNAQDDLPANVHRGGAAALARLRAEVEAGGGQGDGEGHAHRCGEQGCRGVEGKGGAGEDASHGGCDEHLPHGGIGEGEERFVDEDLEERARDGRNAAPHRGPGGHRHGEEGADEDADEAQVGEMLRGERRHEARAGRYDEDAGHNDEEGMGRAAVVDVGIEAEEPQAEQGGADGAEEGGCEKLQRRFPGIVYCEISNHNLPLGMTEVRPVRTVATAWYHRILCRWFVALFRVGVRRPASSRNKGPFQAHFPENFHGS